MKPAGDFLSKFSSMTPPDGALKKALVASVAAVAGVELNTKDISVSRGVAFLQCSSVAKNAIRIVRGKIFENLYERLPKARQLVRDIR